MSKLDAWRPKRRSFQARRIHEVPFHEQEDEWFSLQTFDLNVELTTIVKLLDRFYEWNNTEDGMKPWIVQRLDPQEGAIRHIWYFAHYKDFHAICEHSFLGPHKVHRIRLFYRQGSGRVLWLASAQLGPLFFYSEKRGAEAYTEVLDHRLWYCAESERNKIVPM